MIIVEAQFTTQEEEIVDDVTSGVSVSFQTDLTMQDHEQLEIRNKELFQDNACRQNEITILKLELATKGCGNGYPSQKRLEDDNKLVTFYTGLSNFTVLMAIFEFLTKGNTAFSNMKLSLF